MRQILIVFQYFILFLNFVLFIEKENKLQILWRMIICQFKNDVLNKAMGRLHIV